MAEEKNGEELEQLGRHGIWFVAAFAGLLALFFFWRPQFVIDLVKPFVDFFGLLNMFGLLSVSLGSVFSDYGLFFIFVLAVLLVWLLLQRNPKKKDAKK